MSMQSWLRPGAKPVAASADVSRRRLASCSRRLIRFRRQQITPVRASTASSQRSTLGLRLLAQRGYPALGTFAQALLEPEDRANPAAPGGRPHEGEEVASAPCVAAGQFSAKMRLKCRTGAANEDGDLCP
jgi:hypothetical protein